MKLGRSFLYLSAGLTALYMLLPVIVVVATSFGGTAAYEFPPKSLSLTWFAALFNTEIFTTSLLHVSLPLAVGVAVASTVVGLFAALGMARLRGRVADIVALLFSAPLIFPQVLLGVALFLFYARLNVALNIVSLALAHILIATPYVIRSVTAGLSGIDDRLAQAAQNLGASPIQAFCFVTLPLLKSGILSGAVFAFIVSFSDINLAIFLSAAGNTTLPMQIMAQMQYVSDPTIAAAASAQIVVVSLLVILAQRLSGKVRA